MESTMDIDLEAPLPEPTGEEQTTPAIGQKRRRTGTNSDRSSKKKKTAPSSSSSPEVPPATDMWHLKKSDVPKAAAGVQKALQIHLRILGILCSPFSVLPRVSGSLSPSMQARLSDQHNADASVQAAIMRAATMNREATLKYEDLRNAISHAGSTNKQSSLYRDMRRMLSYEIQIKFAYSALLSLGLSSFTPDIYGNNPDSFFNLLHERIALSTFEHMCTSFAYTAFNVNLRYAKDPVFLQKIYRHFLFSYLRKNGEKEEEQPGVLKEEADFDNVYRRRRNTAKGRVEWLKANGYGREVVALFECNECTSEDEYDAGRGGYVVKAVTGRSPAITSFAAFIDEKRAKSIQPGRGKNVKKTRHAPRTRIRISPPPLPTVVSLPKTAPLDFFDPEYFNENLPPLERIRYEECGVALPPESVRGETVQEHAVWKNMPDEEFMEKYGSQVKAQYNIPTQEELDRIAAYEADANNNRADADADDEDEDEDDDEDDEDE